LAIDNGANLEARGQLIELLRTKSPFGLTASGVSAWAGYGTWKQILKHLADAVVKYSRGAIPNADILIENNPDPLSCAVQLGIHLGPHFPEIIRTEFGPNGVVPHDVLFRIASFSFCHYLTLNFDTSLERVHTQLAKPAGSITIANRTDFLRFLGSTDGAPDTRKIVHLHGQFDDPTDLIALTTHGYRRLYHEGRFFRNAVWMLAVAKPIVFLGYGFNDKYFNEALREARLDNTDGAAQPRHFAVEGIWPEQRDVGRRYQLNDEYLIQPVFYEIRGTPENPDHQGFVELVTGISTELQLTGKPAELPANQAALGHVPPPNDLRRAAEIGDALLRRIDPGGNDVQG
jgi:hypothetical protein